MLANDLACTPLPPQNLHGKEGVDGSSPSEGFLEQPATGALRCLDCKRLSRAGTRGVFLMFARRSHGATAFGLGKRV
jgi:hypothetical protein